MMDRGEQGMFLGVFLFLFSSTLFAMDSVSTLPAGISSPGWRQGYISGADHKYNTRGDLYSLSDLNSVELNVNNLQAIEPDIKKLENALNKFGQNGLGSTLHLGVLKVTTEPTIQYSVPTFGRGISDQWMIGVGLPVVRYTNKLNFFHSGSNINELRAQFYGLSDSIDDAFNRLDQDLVSVAQQTLREKGYKPIMDRRETFLGDIQLGSFYLLYKDTHFGLRWQSFINLPTGPKDDPNDLADLNSFGRTSWENSMLVNLNFWKRFMFAVKGGFKWAVPDKIKMRIPINAQDTLPTMDRLALVDRNIGDSLNVGASLTCAFANGFGLAMGVDNSVKGRDVYSGNLPGDYSLLTKDTQSFSQRMQYEVSYDSVALFLAKKAILPMILALNFSDTFRGRNVERLTQTEMTATLFF